MYLRESKDSLFLYFLKVEVVDVKNLSTFKSYSGYERLLYAYGYSPFFYGFRLQTIILCFKILHFKITIIFSMLNKLFIKQVFSSSLHLLYKGLCREERLDIFSPPLNLLLSESILWKV